ncbi:MAG: SDR family oxidoreductase, partial [Oscillospiraceae bacterium]|nr:SDR family oxidoreductase [Oscillospiraceae bacterium]
QPPASELAPRRVTGTAVAPGFVETDMTRSLPGADKIAESIPLGRLCTPEEIAVAVTFLAAADYITGEVLRVDGGIAM